MLDKRPDWLAHLQDIKLGEFVLDKYLGSGHFGCVYRARLQSMLDEDIFWAIKVSPQNVALDVRTLRKVLRLQGVANVAHLLRVESADISTSHGSDTVAYAVWDYIEPSQSLRRYLQSTKSVHVSFLFGVVTTVLRVLDACQIRGISAHGSLHLGNILVGDPSGSGLDSTYRTVDPIYVTDFGYALATAEHEPIDDYRALADLADCLIEKVDWPAANSADRQLLLGVRRVLHKVLREDIASERSTPAAILTSILAVHSSAGRANGASYRDSGAPAQSASRGMSVGQFQVSEMLGDDWDLWRRLFVPAVPARSRILERDITSVITGPRGCGKTMLFRRLSERLIVQCGPIDDRAPSADFLAFYVNANDFADAFPHFPTRPTPEQAGRLNAFAHLCILSDVLAVEAVLCQRAVRAPSSALIGLFEAWFGETAGSVPIIDGEHRLERYRSQLEQLKRDFLKVSIPPQFPGYESFAHHAWLRTFVPELRNSCAWVGRVTVFFFVDDYTTPRVSLAMQRVLNRIFFHRSHDFVFKVATEAATTFLAEDSSGKVLQDGDDYRLVDMGEESLFMSDDERQTFLNEVFQRRLSLDPRVGAERRTLPALLGKHGYSKTGFARLLRDAQPVELGMPQTGAGLLRGAVKRRALYFGHDVFSSLWSGDTRLMIQLMQDLVEEAARPTGTISSQIPPDLQDRVFRNRGGQWLDMQMRNQPTDAKRFAKLLASHQARTPGYRLSGGTFGTHLKAIAEAFSQAARLELLGPVYTIEEKGKVREVPKMAFRLEITDIFRVEGLSAEIYRDLIRYGIFMRDARGKSIRGAMVPRLFLRRLLLPYCLLALSKRDSVSMSCDWFIRLLLQPDEFVKNWTVHRKMSSHSGGQMKIFEEGENLVADPRYDDISDAEKESLDNASVSHDIPGPEGTDR